MKKFVCLLAVGIFAAATAFEAAAFVRYEDKHPQKIREVRITGFIDYAPFGYTEHPDEKVRGRFFTVFQPMIDEFQKENNLKITYNLRKTRYDALVQSVRRGEIDMILGAYHETEMYKGLELVFPSVLSNPLTVFTLPNRVDEVKSVNDLKKLKGVRLSKEIYSDFVNNQIKEYDIDVVDTPYEMFEKLFTGQADYILISQYLGIIEAVKLGLRGQISEARQTIWNMPLFIGVSKISDQRRMITQKLTRYAEKPENKEKIKSYLTQMILDIEKQYQGVVPPTFGKENTTESPADKKTETETKE